LSSTSCGGELDDELEYETPYMAVGQNIFLYTRPDPSQAMHHASCYSSKTVNFIANICL